MPGPRKRKRAYVQCHTDIPVEQDDVVTRVEFTRICKQRIRTTLTKVSIPVPPKQHSPSQTPEPLPCIPEESTLDNPPDTIRKKTRKGPSRSVAVRISSPSHPRATILTTPAEQPRAMDSAIPR